MKKIMMLGAAILAMQAIPALAEGHGGKEGHRGPGKFFEKLDADKDGSVTEQEFIDGHKAKFAEMDTDKDGKVTKTELEARHAEMKKKWEAKKAERAAKGEEGGPEDGPKPE